jgi:hypothetical protein
MDDPFIRIRAPVGRRANKSLETPVVLSLPFAGREILDEARLLRGDGKELIGVVGHARREAPEPWKSRRLFQTPDGAAVGLHRLIQALDYVGITQKTRKITMKLPTNKVRSFRSEFQFCMIPDLSFNRKKIKGESAICASPTLAEFPSRHQLQGLGDHLSVTTICHYRVHAM